MKEIGFVHNDIKTDNYTIVQGEKDNVFTLRMIDLGEANNKPQSVGFTPLYFMNPLRKKYKSKDG